MRVILALFLLAIHCAAQVPVSSFTKAIKGTFLPAADDHAIIYLNGQQVHKVDYGSKRSPEMELKVGDRVTVHLKNDRDEKGFLLVFVSSDNATLVSFRRTDYKIVPELDATDFTPEQFKRWNKTAKSSPRPDMNFPFKHYSDWVWGDTSKCILSAVVTPQMIAAKPN